MSHQMACECVFCLLYFQKTGLRRQQKPIILTTGMSQAVRQPTSVRLVFSKLLRDTCASWRWSPPAQADRWTVFGPRWPDPDSRRRAGGSFHAHVNVNSSFSHQKNLPSPLRPHPPGPISEQGAMKNTLHNTLCNKRPEN